MSLHSTRPARTISSPFREVWALTDRPLGILTCTSISPSGVWLVSASQDGSVLFLDYKAGILVGILDLESRFYVTAAVWRSDTTLTLGCSNGIVYQLDFEHKSKRPVSINVLIKPLRSPIRSIAFDPYRDMLAIACGGEVWIYVQSPDTSTESWDCVDHILAPCAGQASLVTALCFFGTALSRRHLFIGHAQAGWTIWFAPRSYQRMPLTETGEVCSISSASIAPSEKFIAISTVGDENSLVTYSLGEGGPIISSQAKFDFQKLSDYSPLMPIVSTSSDLVLKGTSIGEIEVLDPRTHASASLHHAYNHTIRTLNAYGDKIVVGSSSSIDNSLDSCLRCYMISSAAEPRDWRRINELQGPIFEITLSSVLHFSDTMVLPNRCRSFNIIHVIRASLKWKQRTAVVLVFLGGLLFALALDPPSRISTPPSKGVSSAYYLRSIHRKPSLSTLIKWCTGYLGSRLSGWFVWFAQVTAWLVKMAGFGGLFVIKNMFFALNLLARVVLLVPRFIKDAVVEVPDALAEFICELLKLHGFDDICLE